MVAIAELLAIIIGIPFGFIITRPGFNKLSPIVNGIVNISQAIPSLAFLAIMAPLLGLGLKSAIFALFAKTLLPIVRNTYAGIANIDLSIIESARGMGMTRNQILIKVELPLARSVIMAGIRTSTVLNVGTATLAALVAAGGLGELILSGIQLNSMELMLQGAAPVACLAIILDTALNKIEEWMTPRGLRRVEVK